MFNTVNVARNGRSFSRPNVNTIEYAVPTDLAYQEYIGGGNYGNVIRVKRRDGSDLAIKNMYDPFSNAVKARRLYRELTLLQLLDHENVIRFVDVYTPDPEFGCFKNVYIVTEYAGVSLKTVLDKQKTNGTKLINFDHTKYIMYQLLRALKYLHSAQVLHRDLKPSNLAITEECHLTVLDFGLARTLSGNNDKLNLTKYVSSRWYRSPEVIYWKNDSYNAKADVWSAGCILAELLTGHVLFPGTAAIEQYRLITHLCGSPDEDLMRKIQAQNTRAMYIVVESMGGNRQRANFGEFFRGVPPDALDLLDKLLVLDPDRRMSVEEAVSHPYLLEYSMPSDEPTADRPFDIGDNDASKNVAEWKQIIWDVIQKHKATRQQDRGEGAEGFVDHEGAAGEPMVIE